MNTPDAARRVALAVDPERLWRRHQEIAAFGATGRGGVNRQALSEADAAARVAAIGWAREAGATPAVDAIGNLFLRRPGGEAEAAPVVAGSHLDSQPTGGNYDGVFGVLAAIEVLAAATDAGVVTRRPLEAVSWTNEEGSRFQPATMGSCVFAGQMALDDALKITDLEGVSVAEALAATCARMGVAETRPFGFPMEAYVEAHIEQGPVLEREGRQIGVVSGIQGLRWFEIEVVGAEGHAGTTPMAGRADALDAACAMIRALADLMADASDTVRFTVGRLSVTPNSPNTIPGRVLFTIDFRHPDNAVLAARGGAVAGICAAHAGTCQVTVRETIWSKPSGFDARVQGLIRDAARRQGFAQKDMVSGATHDAKYMSALCPSGMIFVPCAGGISHNEAERAAPEDLAAGARVLAEVMVALACA